MHGIKNLNLQMSLNGGPSPYISVIIYSHLQAHPICSKRHIERRHIAFSDCKR